MKKAKEGKRKKEITFYFTLQDIGQKDFGYMTCITCGMVYTTSQEEDEAQHAKYHQNIVQKLKFTVSIDHFFLMLYFSFS